MRDFRTGLGALAVIVAVIAGAGHAQTSPAPLSLPATFIGTLPCADCPGIRYQLNLNADHTFSSRMTYEERNTSFDDSGRWQLSDDGKKVLLQGKSKTTQQLALHVVETLRPLDSAGNEIPSRFSYDLVRAHGFAALEDTRTSAPSLENTHWNLVTLSDRPVSAGSLQKEAYIVLDSEKHRVSGSGGCNQLTGTFELKGNQLKFGQMAGTRMACPEGMDTEQAFLTSLGQVTTWKITGQSLELFDSDGKVLAQFKAREH
jgi:heat shock protein HslJ